MFFPEDIEGFAELVGLRGLSEGAKPYDRAKIVGRIILFREVISAGLERLLASGREE